MDPERPAAILGCLVSGSYASCVQQQSCATDTD